MNLENTPLTESILQKLYKSKTYVRDGQWDILWHLGGKNNVVIGEKSGKFFLLPNQTIEKVTEVLPFELVQEEHIIGHKDPKPLHTVADLVSYFEEGKDTQA